jgi:acyl carrier protein
VDEASSPDSVTTEALTRYCVAFVAEMLDRAPQDIDPNATFSRIGFDSAMAVQLVVALEDRLDVELLPDLVGDHPTIARLSTYLSELVRSSRQP